MKYTIILLLFNQSFLFGQSTIELELNSDGVVLPRIEKSDKMMLSPKEGQVFYNPEEGALMYYDGADWISLKGQVVVNDIDENSYGTVKIGGLEWMTSNLNTTKLNDGTPLTMGAGGSSFQGKGNSKSAGDTPTYWYYNNDSLTHAQSYGALYNFCAVATGNLCPSGWHVPTDADWDNLITSLGGYSIAGGAMKETGFSHWLSPNRDATNSSGFTARGSGSYLGGEFYGLMIGANFWVSDNSSSNNAFFKWLDHTLRSISEETTSNSSSGLSVRCVR